MPTLRIDGPASGDDATFRALLAAAGYVSGLLTQVRCKAASGNGGQSGGSGGGQGAGAGAFSAKNSVNISGLDCVFVVGEAAEEASCFVGNDEAQNPICRAVAGLSDGSAGLAFAGIGNIKFSGGFGGTPSNTGNGGGGGGAATINGNGQNGADGDAFGPGAGGLDGDTAEYGGTGASLIASATNPTNGGGGGSGPAFSGFNSTKGIEGYIEVDFVEGPVVSIDSATTPTTDARLHLTGTSTGGAVSYYGINSTTNVPFDVTPTAAGVWRAGPITLALGANTIAVSGCNIDGGIGSDATIVVTRDAEAVPNPKQFNSVLGFADNIDGTGPQFRGRFQKRR